MQEIKDINIWIICKWLVHEGDSDFTWLGHVLPRGRTLGDTQIEQHLWYGKGNAQSEKMLVATGMETRKSTAVRGITY